MPAMAHRLSKIATRTGDAGETGLGDGTRAPKDSPRVQALGDIDELNSALGLLLAEEVPDAMRAALEQVQQDLFDLGGEASIPGHRILGEAQVARLDTLLEDWNRDLPPLKEFVLPGGSRAAAAAHLARMANLYGYIEERSSGAEEIRAAGAEAYAMRRLYGLMRTFTEKTRAALVVSSLTSNLTNLVYV